MPKQAAHIPDDNRDSVYLTEAGLARMERRLAELKAALPDMIAEAGRTAAEGDRSENDAYRQAKSILRRTHRQIWTIEDQLKRVVVIRPGRNAAGTVQIGSTVVVEMIKVEMGAEAEMRTKAEQKMRRTFTIVGPRETDPARGRISQESPLGKALIDHREGDEITVQTADGARIYKIVEVR